MKHIVLGIVLTLLLNNLYSQNCTCYYPQSETTKWQTDSYKGKECIKECVNLYKVTGKESKDGVSSYTIENACYNLDNTLRYTVNYTMKCKDNYYYIDPKVLVDPLILKKYKDYNVSITGEGIDMPKDLSTGQDLSNLDFKVVISNNGQTFYTSTIKITNREVAAVENVSTSAGSFECYKITYNLEINSYLKTQFTVTDWYAKNTGLVKSETKDLKKKLVAKTELKKFKE